MKTLVMRSWRAATVALGLAASMLAPHPVQADEVRVMAANAVREPLLEIAADFERTTGHRVVATWSGTAGIVKRLADGEVPDVVIVGSKAIDKLVKEGKLNAEGRVDFARSGVGIAVGPNVPKPDISTEAAVKAAVLQARSVAYSSGPSGVYVAEMLERMGIADAVKNKLVLPPPTVQVGALLARGEVELGFQQVSDLLPIDGIQFVGPLPPSIQSITIYRGAIHPMAPAPDAARALLRFLAEPAAELAIRKAGMEPG